MKQLNYMLDICRATHRAGVGVIYAKMNLRNRAYTTCTLLNAKKNLRNRAYTTRTLLNVPEKNGSFILFVFRRFRKVAKSDY